MLVLQSAVGTGQDIRINQVASDLVGNVFAPSFYQNGIVVCSDQKSDLLKTVFGRDHLRTTNLYFMPDSIGRYEQLDDALISKYNNGPATFDASSKLMILSRNQKTRQNLTEFQFEHNPMGLYESTFDYFSWSEARALWFVDTCYQFTHPGLSEDGSVLVFVSDLPGGYGGFDIWISYRQDNSWSSPVNAGKEINTRDDESFPSIEGKTIYFSSDRSGFGGLDIYSYDTLSKRAQLIPEPINSDKDDFGLIGKEEFSRGYFTSNRNGRDQIWFFTQERPSDEFCDTLIANILCYSLSVEQGSQLGSGDHLVYQWNINEDKRYGISVDYCFPGEGGYEISLDITDTAVDQTFYNQSYYYLEILNTEQPFISSEDTVLMGERFSLNSDKTNLPEATIARFSWRISDGTRASEPAFEHIFTSPGRYKVELEVEGTQYGEIFNDCVYKVIHCVEETQAIGTKDHENVLEDLVKVIDSHDFFEEGNDTSTHAYSIEIIRTNKKLENDNFLFKLMETYGEVKIHYAEEDREYSYLVGAWENLEDVHHAWRNLVKDGYKDAPARFVDSEKIANFQLENSFALGNVRFNPKSWNVGADAMPDLQNIIEIMLIFPDINLIIEGHTDSNGEEDFNLKLSLKRAQSVKEYIVSKGVDSKRISTEGLGELDPKASNNALEGQEINRRVEFTFVK